MKNLILSSLILLFNTLSLQNTLNAQQAVQPELAPFYHGVASGDPLADQVIIWTRVTPENAKSTSVEVIWKMATDKELTNIVQTGKYTTNATQDYTIKIDVKNLTPNTYYYYQFEALGQQSIVGRTKTAPTGMVNDLSFGVVSCNNYGGGYFSAFRHVANIENLQAVLHLGDYIYEYGDGGYGNDKLNRKLSPNHEVVTLDDYRMRYSLYRMDKDFIKAHQQHPFICIWDDHEVANDSHKDGAQNHQPNQEGDWETRKSVAKQAYFEWLPIRNNPAKTINRVFSYGEVMDLIMLDTRLEGRDPQIRSAQNPEIQKAERTMLGKQQRKWLFDALKNSKAKWKIIGQQVMFSQFNVEFANPLNRKKSANLFLDIWNGYPAERLKVMNFIKENQIDNVVLLTGDFHSSFAYNVTTDPMNSEVYNPETGKGSIAVEFVTPSISSANFDEYLSRYQSRKLEECLNKRCGGFPFFYKKNPNPHMKYADLDRHGYMILNVSAEQTQADWYYLNDLTDPNSEQYYATSWVTKSGENNLNQSEKPIALNIQSKMDKQSLKDTLPCIVTGVFSDTNSVTLQTYIHDDQQPIYLNLKDKSGNLVRAILQKSYPKGMFTFSFFRTDYPKGMYYIEQKVANRVIQYPFELK